MSDQAPVAPRAMFQSFLVVGLNYLTSMILFLGSIWLLALLFFPEQKALLDDAPQLEQVIQNDPTLFFTKPFYWSFLLVNLLLNVGVGYLVAKAAPFASFIHALIVAGVLLVTYFQQSRLNHEDVQWMFTLMMVAFPAAVLLGASFVKAPVRKELAEIE